MTTRKIYVIKNSAGKNVSGFYPNCGDRSRFLVYRDNDYVTFRTKKEAVTWLKYIQRHGVGMNLTIKERVRLGD